MWTQRTMRELTRAGPRAMGRIILANPMQIAAVEQQGPGPMTRFQIEASPPLRMAETSGPG